MNKKKTTLVVALVILGVAVLGLAAAVYAKYVSTFTSGNGSLTVAKWAFESDNSNGTVGCRLDKTYSASTLVNGKIAPGTSGSCTFELKNTNTEVGVDYSISLDSITNQPQHLKVYKDSDHTQELTAASPVTGTLAPKASAQDIVVYWYWPYYTSDSDDEDDTDDGEGAETMEITFAISGVQVQPTE